MKKSVLLIALFALLGMQIYAQNTITGTVKSTQDGLELPGVNVYAKGFATSGTVTAVDGNYTIKVPAEATTLVFTFVGMKTMEIPINGQSVIDVSMVTEDVTLSDVVVTAFGSKVSKKDLGYSIQDVKGDELAKTQRSNFLNSLDGRVAGVQITSSSGQPGASSLITLRGVSSISGNNQPLFIVDGVPMDNTTFNTNTFSVSASNSSTDMANRRLDFANRISDLNPEDFESVTILKGPEASALYGIDAASGAIVITTKKGQNGKGKLTYSNVFSFSKIYHYPERMTNYQRGYSGIQDSTSTSYFGPELPAGTTKYDNLDNYYRTGFSQVHSLSFEGGNDKTTYRLSSNFLDDQGMEPVTKNQRVNLTFSGTTKINERLTIESTMSFVRQNLDKAPRGSAGTYLALLRWPSNDDASIYLNPDGTRRLISSSSYGGDLVENPYFTINKNRFYDKTNRTYGNVGLNFKATSWLNFVGRAGYDFANTEMHVKWHPESAFGYNDKGTVELDNMNVYILTANYFAQVNKILGDFKLNAQVGSEVVEKKTFNTSIMGSKFYVWDFDAINNVDRTTLLSSTTTQKRRIVSGISTFSVDYKNILTLNANYRHDWTSTLPQSFGYPSFNGSFRFTELWKNNILTFGRLRVAYGQAGKDPGPYQLTAALSSQATTNGGFAYGFSGPNPDLKPEFTTSREYGFDLEFFNKKLVIEATYFNKNTKDQLISNMRKSYGGGFVLYNINGGSFKSNGYELTIIATPYKTQDFTWDITGNFSKYNSELTELPTGLTEYYNSDTWVVGNVRNGMIVGSPTTTFTGFDYERSANGQILINPVSGLPIKNSAKWQVIGDRNPDFVFGLNNQFAYKGLSLSFLLNFRKGGDVFNGNEMVFWQQGLSTRTEVRNQTITIPGILKDGLQNTDHPTTNTMAINPYYTNGYYSSIAESDFIDKDINWVKLSDITLSYALPKSILQKTGVISAASVFFTGNDLFFITNYSGVDPNVNANTAGSLGTGGGGMDYGQLPTPRTFKFGVKLSF